jgi:hypothetical protein
MGRFAGGGRDAGLSGRGRAVPASGEARAGHRRVLRARRGVRAGERGIWLLDAVTGGGIEWAYWTTIPWGIGLAIHGVVLLLELNVFGDEWRQRQVERYVQRRRGASSGGAGPRAA